MGVYPRKSGTMKEIKLVLTLLTTWSVLLAYSQNVGVGEPTPGSMLSVKGELAVGTNYSTLKGPDNGLIVEGSVGIGTSSPDPNAVLDLASAGKGLLIPRLTLEQRAAMSNPTAGMMVYMTDTKTFDLYTGTHWRTVAADSVNLYYRNAHIGIGTDDPTSLLSVGSASQFQVDSSGNIVKINNVSLSFPAAQGGSGQVLTNDGSGHLTWANAEAGFGSVIAANGSSTSSFSAANNVWLTNDLGSLTITSSGTYLITLAAGLQGANGKYFSIVLCKRTPPASNSTDDMITASAITSGINASTYTSITTQAYVTLAAGDVISFRGGKTNNQSITGTAWNMTALKVN